MGLKTIPVLASDDLDKTADYYTRLGFTERSRWPEYLIVRRSADNLELHFWFDGSGIDPYQNDTSCYVRCDIAAEAQALYDEWAALDLGDDLREPTATDYGLLEFALIDPHGNLVKVGGFIEQPG